MKLTDLGHDILLEICANVFEDNPRDRVVLSWFGQSLESAQPRIFPGPPAQILLDLALMHSELAAATRPYIWREVLVAFGSYDATERGVGRLERAQQSHIAPFVRMLFLSFRFPYGGSEDHLPLIVDAIPCFVSLRGVCLGVFQSYDQPRMYEDVAKAIREHPAIDTLSVLSMMQCADLIPNGSAKPYNIELNYCHGNSTALLLRPKTVKFLRLHNYDRQGNWPSDIWDSLQHVDPRPEHMDAICSSLQRYLELGRRPALKSLDLSEFRAQKILPMLAVFRGLDLDAFAYVPYQEYLYDVDLLTEILDVVPKVRTLSITNPKGYSAKHRKKEIQIDPDVVGLLSNLPNLERLTLTFERPYYLADSLEDPEDASDLGQPAVGVLSEACPLLRRVRLVLGWSEMDVCLDEPAIVEYLIRRKGPRREVVVERVAPRLLEGTILEFVQWR